MSQKNKLILFSLLLQSALVTSAVWLFSSGLAHAEPPPQLVAKPELSGQITGLIGDVNTLLDRIRRGGEEAEPEAASALSMLSEARFTEGTELILKAQLAGKLDLEGEVWARREGGTWLVSFVDVVSLLSFPIVVNPDEGTAEGWFIREDRLFRLDLDERRVEAGGKVFEISPLAYEEGGDFLIPVDEVFSWFGIGWEIDVPSQWLRLYPDEPLPMQEWIARRTLKQQFTSRPLVPSAPRHEVPYKGFSVPTIDVATRSEFRSGRETENIRRNHLSLTAAGDIAYGTGTANLSADSETQSINQLRLNYRRESENANLLGPLEARRYEIGDLTAARVPLAETTALLWGVRATNHDPERVSLQTETFIEGDAQPGWDVELYRENTLLGLQAVGEDGRYLFEDVSLFAGNNNFLLMFYGPQGEIREEYRNVIVDPRIGHRNGGLYDVSFGKREFLPYHQNRDSPEAGDTEFASTYQRRLSRSVIGEAGLRLSQEDGGNHAVVQAGVSGIAAEVLLDARAALDETGALAGEISARGNLGSHRFAGTLLAVEEGFQTQRETNPAVFENKISLAGPLSFLIGDSTSYTFNADYVKRAEGDDTLGVGGTTSTRIKRLALYQSLNWRLDRDAEGNQEQSLGGGTSLSGSLAGNRIRVNSNYALFPDTALDSVGADINRRIRRDLSLSAGLDHKIESRFTTVNAQANWETPVATISPRISYDTEENLFVGLNSRFGLMQEPRTGDIKAFPRSISGSGAVSALVFVDRDGDGEFSDGDEVVEGAIINAVQAGRRGLTNEKGIALIADLPSGRVTDVILNADTLPDPFWIPAGPGNSVLPRPGFPIQLDIPVVVAGEIEGLVHGLTESGVEVPLRQVRIHLVDMSGGIVTSARTAGDGLFIFSLVPPGEYLLVVDSRDVARSGFSPPPPRPVTIAYDGTEIYGENFLLPIGPNIPFAAISSSDQWAGTDFVLHLGDYQSPLARVLALYKLRLGGTLPAGATILAGPAEPLSLRAYWPSTTLDEAYSRCRAAISQGVPCAVEVVATSKLL